LWWRMSLQLLRTRRNKIRDIMLKKIKKPKIREASALTKDGYGLVKLNELGYPVNDPYGLAAAFCSTKGPFTVFKFLRRT
jgi:hypothetical protein